MEDQELMREQAQILTDRGYRHQVQGELGDAIALYRRSIAMYPTAEAHTYLGWAYNMMDRNEEAIAECEKAIAIDPDLGNPYNDIGAYLLEMGRPEEAIPWLEQAIVAPRYATPQFAHLNLGRAYEQLGEVYRALAAYDQALAIAPLYLPAHWAKTALLGRLN
ncbi:MAG TPA: tetratricopeptide repeat protein [Promineifilum sp.]|nr:tetratricopeptide repeat protein [Promineifilum sp.]HNS40971.1 tetratricopeptide repeat protein [Promineifilum sp.]